MQDHEKWQTENPVKFGESVSVYFETFEHI